MEQLDTATDSSMIDVTPSEQAAAENRRAEDADATSTQDGKAGEPADDDAEAQASTATVCIAFRDFGFEPIEGLKYKLKVDDQFKKGITDAEGNATTLTDLIPGSDIEIFVFREYAKDFKSIGTLRAYSGCTGYSIVSPKLKYDVTTELHSGEPGGAEMNMPPSPPISKDSEQESASSAPAGAMSPSDTATKKEASSQMPAPGKPTTSQPGVKTTNKSAPAQQKNGQATPGRDSNGHPQATVQDSTLDRLKRKILIVFNFWHWQDFQEKTPRPSDSASNGASSKKSSTTKNQGNKAEKSSSPPAPAQAAQGHPRVNPLSSPAVATSGKRLEGADLTRLQALIEFAEKQVEFNYLPYKGKEGTTVNVLKEYAKQEMPPFGMKPPIKPLGLCQVYVKIALFKAGYTNGPGWEGQAKTSGRDWLKYGFTEVGSTLPQIEITYEDALSPNDRPQAETCIKRKAALKKLQEERKKQKKPMTAEEIAAVEKDIPSMPEKKREVKYIQPDLMYTLPGDVIVYEQVDPVELDPAGHVDIRTYHGFMSDFAWARSPSLGGPAKPTKRYRVTGVYRKCSDTMAMARVQAFLKIIRMQEIKGFSQSESYFVLPDAKDGNGKYLKRKFSDTSTHPFSDAVKEHFSNTDYYGHPNTAAGAYQIKLPTWANVVKETGWPRSFTPAMQDRIALFLLARRTSNDKHPKRTALGYIMEGKIEEAIQETRLWNEWSSLPLSSKKYTMSQLKEDYEKYLKEFEK